MHRAIASQSNAVDVSGRALSSPAYLNKSWSGIARLGATGRDVWPNKIAKREARSEVGDVRRMSGRSTPIRDRRFSTDADVRPMRAAIHAGDLPSSYQERALASS
jgi:hypothetical protein